jgi:hypothetical protein
MISLLRYVDHHAGADEDIRPDPQGLGTYFHFKIQDAAWPSGCVATDNRKAFGDLKPIYGFDGVKRTAQRSEQQIAGWLSIGTANAAGAQAPGYAGLSSEFAYNDGSTPACFGFSAPVPTISGYAGGDWAPLTTSIFIQQLHGRRVTSVLHTTVTWMR